MQLHEITLPGGAKKKRKRVGRGVGSGRGKTSGRGMGGQRKRSNPRIRPYFEGGQMPLIRRIPKRGFNNQRFSKVYQIVNTSALNRFSNGDKVTPEVLLKAGLIKDLNRRLKILGEGTLEKKLEVYAHAFSRSAKEKIESSGGKVVTLGKRR